MRHEKPVRLKPPSVRAKDRRAILKAVPKLQKIKAARPGK